MIPQRVHNFGTYFVSTQTWQRRNLFRTDELAQLLIDTVVGYRDRGRFLLHEFVIMPNHLHLLITPSGITLERAMQFIKGGYSHVVTETGRKSLEVWQKGFADHRIRDAEDYERHRGYIHDNPVQAGLCTNRTEYRWSSASGTWTLDDVPQRLKPTESFVGERHG
ncbi:MAG TPA: transposase [Terriglobales bacterium]|nr:transposase [Terriglobales bacterium]